MKIIHCADLHLDSKLNRYFNAEEAAERNRELSDTFNRLADTAVKENVKVIMICGDMFDTKHVRVKTKKRVYETIKNHPDIDFLYLTGNHDGNDFLEGAADLQNLLTFSDEGWTKYEYDDVCICGADINNKNITGLAVELVLDRNKKNIVMLHGQEEDSGRDAKGGAIIPIRKFAGKSIDYMALGHIHSYSAKELDERGVCVYSGCLEGRGYDETGDKGYVMIDTDGVDGISYSFVPFAKRSIHEISIIAESKDTTSELIKKAENAFAEVNRMDMVKLVIQGAVSEDFTVDTEEIIAHFEELFYHFRLDVNTTLYIDMEKLALDKSLKGEFLRLVFSSDLSEDEKNRIAKLGVDAFYGE